MQDRKLMKIGGIGTAIAAVCCFTPLLAVISGALGLTAWLAKADYVLYPTLVLFTGITAYGYYRHRRAESCGAATPTRTGDMKS